MKNKALIITSALCVAYGMAVSSCSKKEEAPVPAGDTQKSAADAQKTLESQAGAAQKAATDAQKTATDSANSVSADAQKAASDTANQTQAAAADTSAKAQGFIDQAKGLLADKKYSEALSALKPLANLKLTPEQQQVVNELTAQIQKAMASSAIQGLSK